MKYTEVTLNSYSVNVDAETAEIGYRIDALCTIPGELPTIYIFAYSIADIDDPTADKFDHVATVHEIQDVIIGRDDAIAADRAVYFLSFAEFTYSDIDVAIQARAQLRTRLNDLARGWIQFRDDFYTGETNNLFPSSDPDVEDETIEVYADAKAARQEAEAALVVAEAAVVAAAADIDNAQEFIDIYVAQEGYLVVYEDQLYVYWNKVVNEGGDALAYRTGTMSPSAAAELAAIRAKLQQRTNIKAGRQTTYETALQTKIAADQELAAAQVAEDEALAAALAANPDFNPDSV